MSIPSKDLDQVSTTYGNFANWSDKYFFMTLSLISIYHLAQPQLSLRAMQLEKNGWVFTNFITEVHDIMPSFPPAYSVTGALLMICDAREIAFILIKGSSSMQIHIPLHSLCIYSSAFFSLFAETFYFAD